VVARFESNKISDKLKQKQDELTTVSKELENLGLQQRKAREDLKVKLAKREVNLRKATRKTQLLESTTAQIESQKLQLDRTIAEQDLQLYQSKLQHLRANAALTLSIKQREQQSLQAEVALLEADLARMQVTASKAGLFVYATNYEGDKFAVGDSVHTGETFAEIPSLDKMVVKAKVSERDLGKLKRGMAVELVLDAHPEVKYHGKLSVLGAVIQAKAKNNPEKVIEAQVTIVDPDHRIMRPGMIARLLIVVERHQQVIVLPNQAISRDNGHASVQVLSWLGGEQREVEVLAFDQLHTAIGKGLAAGEEVIL
jgi:macrolide-specific efflux system membrane fusion protein